MTVNAQTVATFMASFFGKSEKVISEKLTTDEHNQFTTEATELQEQVTNLESAKTTLEGEKTTLEARIETLTGENTTLESARSRTHSPPPKPTEISIRLGLKNRPV